MSPLAKSGLTWLAAFCLLGVAFTLRYQMVLGRFQGAQDIKPAVCRAIAPGLPGTEDIAFDAAHNVLLFSSRNRLRSDPRDGLYLLPLGDLTTTPVKLAGVPRDFHPAGIDLYRGPDGSENLMVIDAKPNGVRIIEIFGLSFDGDTARLSQQSAIQSGLLAGPSDLAAIGPSAFYLANDHGAKSGLLRFAEDYLLWPHADVVAFNGMGFHIAVQRIAAPSGVLVRGGYLYVTAMNERRLLAFSREDFTGNLTEIGSLSIPARLDKISLDGGGNLIIAGQSKPGSAQVFRVKLGSSGVPQSYETIFSDDGHTLKGANAAVVAGGHLFIGSALDNKMLDCALK